MKVKPATKKVVAKVPIESEDSEEETGSEQHSEADSGSDDDKSSIADDVDEAADPKESESDYSSEEDDVLPANNSSKLNDKILSAANASDSSDSDDSDPEDDAPAEISSKQFAEDQRVEVYHIDKDAKPLPAQARPSLAYDKEDEKKTVFVGNIPNESNVNETRIKDLFSQYGEIRSVRFRSDNGRVIFSKKHKKECKSFIAYVVFKKEEDAQKSMALNGYALLEHHLRVNMANSKTEAFSSKGTIFVGNLPFEASEAEIHQYFSQVGDIEYVRTISKKGIGYVCFKKGVNLSIALKLNDKPFKGRNLRISRCESKEKQEKNKLFKKDPKTGRIVNKKVHQSHKMNDDRFLKGRANNNPIIKKIKDTHKAKFNRFSAADQPSKKELFRPGGQRDRERRDKFREHSNKKQKFSGAKIEGVDKKSKKSKSSKHTKEQKVIVKKLKSAATRAVAK